MRRRVGLLLTLLTAASGCPGAIDNPREDSGAWPDTMINLDFGPADAAALDAGRDLAADQGPQDATPSCKPEDAMTPCDPIKPSGCTPGAGCYLVQGQYLDCVCPAGSKAAGASCTTTVQCQPGYACAGSTPPGTCRRVCSLTASACPSGTTCKSIPSAPQYGVCQ